MKHRHNIAFSLMLCAMPVMASGQASTMQSNEQHVMITPQEMTWTEGPNALPPGTKLTVIQGDLSKPELYTVRLKVPANYNIPAHWHSQTEHVTVLQGTFYMGEGDKLDKKNGKELTVGSFAVMPKKVHHYAWSGNDEVVLQLHGMGPWDINYIEPNDDPRKNMNKK